MSEYEFACNCNDDTKAKVEAAWLRADEILKSDGNHRWTFNRACSYFEEWGTEISFASDQWGAIIATNKNSWEAGKGPGDYSTFVQCDDYSDGMIYTFLRWHDHFAETKPDVAD